MADIQQMIEALIPRMRRYARALVRDVEGADDLVQESLVRALAKRHLWEEGTNLPAWLFTIVHNQHINQIRRSIHTGTMLDIDTVSPVLSEPANQDKRLELRDLDRALGQLAVEQRVVVLLVGLESMPYTEISALLGVPVGTVRSRLSRGRQQLRQLMGREDWSTQQRIALNRAIAQHRKPLHSLSGSGQSSQPVASDGIREPLAP
jgi:RNA polymerase sigma-70 factor (ECF subfamily)